MSGCALTQQEYHGGWISSATRRLNKGKTRQTQVEPRCNKMRSYDTRRDQTIEGNVEGVEGMEEKH